MSVQVFESASEQDTDRIGAELAARLPDGAVVALNGTLGAGKTRLVQAIAVACGVPREEVVSPTFVLCQQYVGTRTINHLDAYRLKDAAEFRELGADELFAADLTIIEWADKIAAALPEDHVQINIEVTGPTSRRFTIRGLRGPAASIGS